jgi:hypothetical protein
MPENWQRYGDGNGAPPAMINPLGRLGFLPAPVRDQGSVERSQNHLSFRLLGCPVLMERPL